MNNKIFFLIVVVIMAGICLLVPQKSIADEGAHLQQIQMFIKGDYHVIDILTVFPMYHAFMATISFGITSIVGLRIINLIVLVLFSVFCFNFILKDKFRTIQTMLFPTIFLFYFIIYTDIFSMCIVLIAYLFLIKEKYWSSAFFLLAASLVRQNNIIWAGFFILYVLIKYFALIPNFKNSISISIKKLLPIILSVVAFAIIVLVSGKLVQGDTEHHQIGFYTGNILLFLFVVAIAYLPLLNINKIKEKLKDILIWFGFLLLLIAVMTFKNTHKYNNVPGLWFNMLLMNVDNNFLIKIVFFIICFIGLLLLSTIEFKDKKNYLLYVGTFVYLGASALIEPRYSTIPLIFINLFRIQEINKKEKILFVYWLLLAIAFFFTLLT